jgi:fatty acid desaturase
MCINPLTSAVSVAEETENSTTKLKDIDSKQFAPFKIQFELNWLAAGFILASGGLYYLNPTFLRVSLGVLTVVVYTLAVFKPDFYGVNRDRLSLWKNSQCRQQDRKDLRKITLEEFQEQVAKGRQWTVLDGYVVDLIRLGVHPGGDYLDRFVGRDVTPWFLCQHAKNNKVLKVSRHCTVAKLDPKSQKGLLCAADQDYLTLHEQAVEEGIFDVKRAWLLRDAMEVFCPSVIGYYVMWTAQDVYTKAMGMIIMQVGVTRVGWVFHDIMHYGLFDNTDRARWWARWPFLIVLGFDFLKTGDIHAIHHTFPNVIGLDTAMQMEIIKLHPGQGKPLVPRGGQNAMFYGFLTWMVLPYYAVAGVIANRRAASMLAIMAVRLYITIYFWKYFAPILAANVIGFAWFALWGSLNHFHMDMGFADDVFPRDASKKQGPSFVVLQSHTVQNTESTMILDAISGHLTLHIEHHLFPHAPRHNYRILQPRVLNLLKRYNLFYDTCSQASAMAKFNEVLLDPTSKHSNESAKTLMHIPTATKAVKVE